MKCLIACRFGSIVALTALAAACSGETNGSTSSGGTAGVGGASGGASGGSGGDPRCDAAFAPIDPTALIDDMEDGNGLVAVTAGRNGSWWVSTDGTATGSVTPPADAAPIPERILGGRCQSSHAIRVTGQGFTNWGAVLSAGMGYSATEAKSVPIDASAFTGVMFWARVGEQNGSAIRFQIQDNQTRPEGELCASSSSGSTDGCYNGFGTAVVPINTEWNLYKMRFAAMTQRDFGYRADQLNAAAIYDIEWNLDANAVFDLWIDDVWFF